MGMWVNVNYFLEVEDMGEVAQLKRDVGQEVPLLVTEGEKTRKLINEGILLLSITKDDTWWWKKKEFTCWQLAADAAEAMGCPKLAEYFRTRHQNRRDDLEFLVQHIEIVRKRTRNGRLITPDLTPKYTPRQRRKQSKK